jgi:hypothetical protein
MSRDCSIILLTVDTKFLYNILHFLKNDKCTALQGSNLVTDSGRERDLPLAMMSSRLNVKPTQPPIQLALGGGVRSPWAKSAKAASNGEIKHRWSQTSVAPLCLHAIWNENFAFLIYVHVTVPRNKFIFNKPTRCTNFTNLFWRETVHVSESSSVHHQEFIHCTLSSGICHTGL